MLFMYGWHSLITVTKVYYGNIKARHLKDFVGLSVCPTLTLEVALLNSLCVIYTSSHQESCFSISLMQELLSALSLPYPVQYTTGIPIVPPRLLLLILTCTLSYSLQCVMASQMK